MSGPNPVTNQTSAALVMECEQADCEILCRIDGASFAVCAASTQYSDLAAGLHHFEARSADAVAGPVARDWTIDLVAPVASIVLAPPDPTAENMASLSFTCNEGSCTFECSLDGDSFAACTSPADYTALADGTHTFEVRATDPAGNLGPTAVHTWQVDTAGTLVTITLAPSDPTGETEATFEFACDDPACSPECRLDAAPFAACTSPITYSALSNGAHTFQVRARDAVGNLGATTSHMWTVDTMPPATVIMTWPANPTNVVNATLTFGCSESACTFECALDGAPFAGCVSPATYLGLADGPHTFAVRATDAAGNVGAQASRAWTVDTVPPTVTITSAPNDPTNVAMATLVFTCGEPGCAFQCSVDGAPFVTCISPSHYPGLPDGPHLFLVVASDPAGNPSALASAGWTLDTLAPTTTITTGPIGFVQETTASFEFTVDEPATQLCRLDGGPWSACTSPVSFGPLPDERHQLETYATDAAGNQETPPAVRVWRIDTGPAPNLVSVSPSSGTVEVPVVLEGANLGATQQGRFVSIGGLEAQVRHWSDSYIVVMVPAGLPAGPAPVVVEAFAPSSASYLVIPWIRTVDPRSAAPGELLTANGASFGAATGSAALEGMTATISSWSDTAVQLAVPAGMAGGPSYVTLETAAGEATNRYPITVRGNDVWIPLHDAPSGRAAHTAVWTGTEMIVWGGYRGNDFLRSGGKYDPATDTWVATNLTGAPSPRYQHSAVWTGSTMVVFGGAAEDGGTTNTTNTGGRYDPTTDSWVPTSTLAAPTTRLHAAVWTGSEMLVWGGLDASGYLNTGARYSLASDSWTAISSSAAPTARAFHKAVWTGSEMIVWGGSGSPSPPTVGGRYDPETDTWAATSATDAPSGRSGHCMVWTGTEALVWGGSAAGAVTDTGGRYDPATNTWTATALAGAPAARASHVSVWTGSELVIWGGAGALSYVPMDSGGRYDPQTDSWAATSATEAPIPRSTASAVWSGAEMIVWGGSDFDGHFTDSGGRYDPETDTWIATATEGTPEGRYNHSLVWTGAEALVWGGTRTGGTGGEMNTGGRYDPATDTWVATSTVGAPSQRYVHTAVWSGTWMIVWGGWAGAGSTNTGGRYDPVTDSWLATATSGGPTARTGHSAIWTGARMVVWGGDGSSYMNNGGRYDPVTNTWTTTSTIGAPVARTRHTAVWTGSRMIVWGGDGAGGGSLSSGGRYDPTANSWTATSTTGTPAARDEHTAIWTGTEMIVWGGGSGVNTGGRYNPTSDSWAATTTIGAPVARRHHVSVWTGSKMLVWGGSDAGNTGGAYDPTTDAWTATSTVDAPSGRTLHGAVWTGSEMFVWGGYPHPFVASPTASAEGARYLP